MDEQISLYQIIAYLKEKSFKPELQEENNQVYFEVPTKKGMLPAFASLRSDKSILQLIVYLPFELREETLGPTARLLHLLNRELDVPGFGMDEKHQLLFFRVIIPSLEKVFVPKLFEVFLAVAKTACETFVEAVSNVIAGKVNVDQLKKNPLKV